MKTHILYRLLEIRNRLKSSESNKNERSQDENSKIEEFVKITLKSKQDRDAFLLGLMDITKDFGSKPDMIFEMPNFLTVIHRLDDNDDKNLPFYEFSYMFNIDSPKSVANSDWKIVNIKGKWEIILKPKKISSTSQSNKDLHILERLLEIIKAIIEKKPIDNSISKPLSKENVGKSDQNSEGNDIDEFLKISLKSKRNKDVVVKVLKELNKDNGDLSSSLKISNGYLFFETPNIITVVQRFYDADNSISPFYELTLTFKIDMINLRNQVRMKNKNMKDEDIEKNLIQIMKICPKEITYWLLDNNDFSLLGTAVNDPKCYEDKKKFDL